MNRKLSDRDIAEVIEAYRLGYSAKDIAECLDVDKSTVGNLLRRRKETRPFVKMSIEEKKRKDAFRSKRYYLENLDRCKAYRKDYYEKHKRDPGGQLERSKAKYRADPIAARAVFLEYKYKLPITSWNEMLIRQSGRCAICNVPMRAPHVDHNHTTGRVRELLCAHCNRGLGDFRESANALEKAAAYVRKHSAEDTQQQGAA